MPHIGPSVERAGRIVCPYHDEIQFVGAEAHIGPLFISGRQGMCSSQITK